MAKTALLARNTSPLGKRKAVSQARWPPLSNDTSSCDTTEGRVGGAKVVSRDTTGVRGGVSVARGDVGGVLSAWCCLVELGICEGRLESGPESTLFAFLDLSFLSVFKYTGLVVSVIGPASNPSFLSSEQSCLSPSKPGSLAILPFL